MATYPMAGFFFLISYVLYVRDAIKQLKKAYDSEFSIWENRVTDTINDEWKSTAKEDDEDKDNKGYHEIRSICTEVAIYKVIPQFQLIQSITKELDKKEEWEGELKLKRSPRDQEYK